MVGLFDETTSDVLGIIRPEDLTWDKALELFETFYMASRNLAPRTRVEYRTDIVQLIDFLNGNGGPGPAEIGLSHLQAFLAHLDTRGLSGVTRRRKTASIKAFFAYLVSVNLIPRNLAQQLIPPEREYKEPRFLTIQEYQALLRACAHETRDAAIIELILQTGIRLSEVARLKIHDIELPLRINRDPANTGSLYVQGKGRKNRTLPINYKAGRALKAWLAVRPDVDHLTLFITKFQEPMGPRAIERAVEKYVKAAGLHHVSVHTLRHTFATQHVAHGTNLRTIQEALGHADLKTTSIYVSTAKEAMKRELQHNAL